MGVEFSVKNNRHEVSMDLQDGKSVISFKVKERRNSQNPHHFIHYKRYKYFQLPAQIKAKFKSVAQFHEHLFKNAEIITLGQTSVIIQLDGEKISIHFENLSNDSIIFRETENIQMDNKRNEMSKNIHVIIGDQIPNGKKNNSNDGQEEKNKDALKGVIRKIIRKNNPLQQVQFKGQSMSELVQMLKKEWDHFDSKGPMTPNMTKKKTPEIINEKEDQNNEILMLKAQIKKKTKQIQALKIQFECYKNCFNFEKFNDEQRKSEQATRKRVIDEFLADISDHFNRATSSTNSSSITIQITTKAGLFTRIENMAKQLQGFKLSQQRNSRIVKKEAKNQEIEYTKTSGFSEIMEDKNLDQSQKMEISKFLDIQTDI